MVKYYSQRFACLFSGIIISIAVAVFVTAVFEVAIFSGEATVKERLDANMSAVIDEIEKSYDKTSQITGIDREAFSGTVNKSNFYIISSEVARNLLYGYKTDFTANSSLYSAYSAKLSSYASEKKLTFSSSELSLYASLATENAAYAINDSKTDSVALFRNSHSAVMLIVLGASVVLTAAAFVVIEFLNKGRHKRFVYYGSGICGAGFLLTGAFYYVKTKKYISDFRFCSFKPYSDAIASCVDNAVKYILIIGIVLAVAGFIILAVNYDYFRRKNRDAKLTREMNRELMKDYLDSDKAPKHSRSDDGDFEKEVMKIDFEE